MALLLQKLIESISMKFIHNLLGGLAGAVALNLIHETVRRFDPEAPEIQLVGEEAMSKSIKALGGDPPTGEKLYAVTLVSDIVTNALYFSAVGLGKKKYLWWRGAGYGLAAGVGALELTNPMGLSDAPITKTKKTSLLTVSWYLIGGLVAALTIDALDKRKS